MIGSLQIDVKIISRVDARINAEAMVTHVVGPNESTVYAFPLTITSNLQSNWALTDDDEIEDGLRSLIAEMYDGSIGLNWSAPKYGYWFDQHNSAATAHKTVNKMRNEGRTWFLQNPAEEDRVSGIFGGAILTELEQIDAHFVRTTGQRLLRNPDRAFARSQAVQDLSTPPDSDQDFISKVSVLSVIIDNFGVQNTIEVKEVGSLDALKNWLADKVGQDEAQRLTETFSRVRGLRNQYPLHDRYDRVSNGQAVERNRVKTATQFFGFLDHDDSAAKWKKVCDRFRQAVQELEQVALS